MVIIDRDENNKLEICRHKQPDGSYNYLGNAEGATYNELLDKISLDLYPVIYDEAVTNGIGDMESFINKLIEEEAKKPKESPEEKALKAKKNAIIQNLKKMSDFFTEFHFAPSFRFINTLCNKLAKNRKAEDGITYILNYFKLIDNPYIDEVKNKVKSAEFKNMMTALTENITPTHHINNRLKIYYGAQGTGKTTVAQTETQFTIVCNASMQPSDLVEDFVFDDGKASFHPSILVHCMEEGKPILLDEINLLTTDCLRFLQGICDGKTSFNYKGQTIHIKDGFMIIGTMNLVINGMTSGLTEPLVDRCSDLREFVLDASQLYDAI